MKSKSVSYSKNLSKFAKVFGEALQDLQDGSAEVPASFGQHLSVITPKVEGASRLEHARDLELPNEHRRSWLGCSNSDR